MFRAISRGACGRRLLCGCAETIGMGIRFASGDQPTFAEFFAGGGMARAGLQGWRCLLANDFCPTKASSYRDNWGGQDLVVGDVRGIAGDLAARVGAARAPLDLAWASFPCQDLSLAGDGAGLDGERSGALYGFFDTVAQLGDISRRPGVIVLENVPGALTSNGGADFRRVVGHLIEMGYRVGAVTLDAAAFVPQSRPRLFFIALEGGTNPPDELTRAQAGDDVPAALREAVSGLSDRLRRDWVWWRLPAPPARGADLADILEEVVDTEWDDAARTRGAFDLMSVATLAKVAEARRQFGEDGRRRVGAFFRRTRVENGAKIQRVEIRFDGLAGCLRTAAGGSSVQRLLVIDGAGLRTRRLTPREAARLMGLPDSYRLPTNRIAAYDLLGDGLVAPVVRFLSDCLLKPLAACETRRRAF